MRLRWFFPVLLLSFVIATGCGSKDNTEDLPEESEAQAITEIATVSEEVAQRGGIKTKNIGPLNQVFNDSNHVQLRAAIQMGIDPVTDLNKAYFTKRPLVKVESNQFYQIDNLTHSVPYLVPEAATLLEDIGRNFIDTLQSRGGNGYKIKVTSLLRTPSLVEKLRKVNVNATDSSTHQFATTFDISYSNFYPTNPSREISQDILKNLLGEVLLDLRNQERCFVKFEYKTACFHVTVAK